MRLIPVMAVLLAAVRALGADAAFDRGAIFTFLEENDLFVETDRHYTQGIKLSYFHEDGFLPLGSKFCYDALPLLGMRPEVGRLGYSVGQNIYTPSEITNRTVLRDDRPYSGWLYLGAILQRRGWIFGDKLTEDDVELELGVVGPWALAGEAQTWVHEIRGFDLPKGWRYQIKNEPGVRLKMSRAIRLLEWHEHHFGFDFTPRAGASLGNVDTSLRAGAMVRLGFNMPDEFGYHTIDSIATASGGISKSKPLSWSAYVFAATEGRAVFFNTTLDGSMYHDSHSVQRKWLVGDSLVGFVVAFRHIEVGYTHTFRSPEYRGQEEHDSFGSVLAMVRF